VLRTHQQPQKYFSDRLLIIPLDRRGSALYCQESQDECD
jgi:hypothetical protein